MDHPPAHSQVRPYRRGQHTNASRQRLAARASLAAARARDAAPQPAPRLAQRGVRAHPAAQRAGPAGGGDESDSEDSRILDAPGDDGSDAGHSGSDDEMAGGVPAVLGQPGGLLAQLPGYRAVRVRLSWAGFPWHQGSWGKLQRATLPPPRAPTPACEHCHTIPYQKGACCSNVGVRTECPKCTFMCAGGTVYVRRGHCLCAQGGTVYVHRGGTVYVHRGGTVYVHRGGTVYVRRGTVYMPRGHCLCAQGALSGIPLHPHSPSPFLPLLTP